MSLTLARSLKSVFCSNLRRAICLRRFYGRYLVSKTSDLPLAVPPAAYSNSSSNNFLLCFGGLRRLSGMIRSVGGRPACSRARRRASLLTLSLWRDFDFVKLNARLTLRTGVAQLFLRDAGFDCSEERVTGMLLSSLSRSTVHPRQLGRDSHAELCHAQDHSDFLDGVPGPGVAPGRTGHAGTETGSIIRFTNGLIALWTGDSGLIGEWPLRVNSTSRISPQVTGTVFSPWGPTRQPLPLIV